MEISFSYFSDISPGRTGYFSKFLSTFTSTYPQPLYLRPHRSSIRVLWRFLELRKLAHWRGWMLRALLLVFGLVHASPFVHVRDPFGVRRLFVIVIRRAPEALAVLEESAARAICEWELGST